MNANCSFAAITRTASAFLLALFTYLSAAPVSAEPRHAVYGEVGGSAVLWSANYEIEPFRGFIAHAGVGAVPLCWKECGAVVVTPVGVSALVGGMRHRAEFGIGYTLIWMDDTDARFIVPSVGYRYQADGGFLFRLTATPLLRANDFADVLPLAGASFGYSF